MNTDIDSSKIHDTRQKIIKCFLDLYAERSFEQIHIKFLTEVIGINRGTFYLHFLDLNDLIESIEDEQMKAIANIGKQFRYFYYSEKSDEFAQFFKAIFDYIVKNKEVFKILTSPHSRPNFRESFLEMMRNNSKQKYHSILVQAKGKELLKKEYIIESIINGNLGVILCWIQSNINLTTEELAELMSYTVLKSPLEIMKSNIK